MECAKKLFGVVRVKFSIPIPKISNSILIPKFSDFNPNPKTWTEFHTIPRNPWDPNLKNILMKKVSNREKERNRSVLDCAVPPSDLALGRKSSNQLVEVLNFMCDFFTLKATTETQLKIICITSGLRADSRFSLDYFIKNQRLEKFSWTMAQNDL